MGIADRKAREKEARRNYIMEAANRLFREKGFSGTTMEDIARDVELSTSTIYLYFKNKEELYASLNLKVLKNLLEKIEEVDIEDVLPPEEKVLALKKLLYSFYEYDPMLLLDVFNFQTSELIRELSPQIVLELKQFARNAVHSIAKIFEFGIKDGVYKPVNTVALADVIWSMFSGLVIWEESKTALNSKKQHMEATLDLAFDIIHDGIKISD
ncbi:MAG: TetR/AcrR family transcriptional regulator [Desulfobacterales bacterium]|nr:TetR/AcrR family transcriptional regulator [Desulfobacterales bacterium]MCP4161729.1 TetR/AcrR family transcriptional regulator [Deltaproteobacteria bacterium]